MSRKYIRRFIQYHPGLFQDRKLFVIMKNDCMIIDIKQLSRIIVRYRKAQSSDYLMLQLKKLSNQLDVDFHEILALNRASNFIDLY